MRLVMLDLYTINDEKVVADTIENAIQIYKNLKDSKPITNIVFEGNAIVERRWTESDKPSPKALVCGKEVETIDSCSIVDNEKILIERVLTDCKWNRKIASNKLGISERTLYRKMKEYGL